MAPAHATKVVLQTENQVELLLNLRYFTNASDEFLRITVKKLDARWLIDQVERVSRDDWEASE